MERVRFVLDFSSTVRKKWNFLPSVMSYWCDNPKRKDMSAVKHGTEFYRFIKGLAFKRVIRRLELVAP